MIMANRDFLENRNINERNSLLDLVQNISPDSEEEVNFIDHSIYYNDQDYKDCVSRSKGALRILYDLLYDFICSFFLFYFVQWVISVLHIVYLYVLWAICLK